MLSVSCTCTLNHTLQSDSSRTSTGSTPYRVATSCKFWSKVWIITIIPHSALNSVAWLITVSGLEHSIRAPEEFNSHVFFQTNESVISAVCLRSVKSSWTQLPGTVSQAAELCNVLKTASLTSSFSVQRKGVSYKQNDINLRPGKVERSLCAITRDKVMHLGQMRIAATYCELAIWEQNKLTHLKGSVSHRRITLWQYDAVRKRQDEGCFQLWMSFHKAQTEHILFG